MATTGLRLVDLSQTAEGANATKRCGGEKKRREGEEKVKKFRQHFPSSERQKEGARQRGVESPTHLLTVAAAEVVTVHAPPAITFLQALHSQIPTAVRFTES